MKVNFRGYAAGELLFEDHLDCEVTEIDSLIPRLVEKHVHMLPPRHMMEIEFPDEPNPLERYYRIGTDPAMMVNPRKVQL